MKPTIQLIGAITLLTTAGCAPAPTQTQEPEKKSRIETHVIRIGGPEPKPAVPRPGDRVDYDPAAGQYAVEFRDRDGKLHTGRVTPGTNIAPKVGAAYESAGSGLVRYRYTLANGESAKQQIRWFGIAVSDETQIQQLARPAGWTLALRSPSPPIAQNWFADNGRSLRSGESVNDEFSFVSSALPGRTEAFTMGPSPDWGPFNPDKQGISPWVKAQLESILSIPNNLVKTPTVGPKIATQGLTAPALLHHVYNELVSMGAAPNLIQAFRDFSQHNDKTAALSYRDTLANMGQYQLERDLYAAMAFNLDYLASIP